MRWLSVNRTECAGREGDRLTNAVAGCTNAPADKSESSSNSRRSTWHGTSSQQATLLAGCVLVTCGHAGTRAVLLYWQRAATSLPWTFGLTLHSRTRNELAIGSSGQVIKPRSCADVPELYSQSNAALSTAS